MATTATNPATRGAAPIDGRSSASPAPSRAIKGNVRTPANSFCCLRSSARSRSRPMSRPISRATSSRCSASGVWTMGPGA